ncbi:hypothetical protein O6P43_016646 [Quillaja saponaria]|uniref:Uncharacterized protein n=1 Tax=Quillaja saponaria TaxID=32244 RepID=A0AAD7PMJ0_QUISA|nr:hypothetical protein O6P43_016646 [Quillaja saponaria]
MQKLNIKNNINLFLISFTILANPFEFSLSIGGFFFSLFLSSCSAHKHSIHQSPLNSSCLYLSLFHRSLSR